MGNELKPMMEYIMEEMGVVHKLCATSIRVLALFKNFMNLV